MASRILHVLAVRTGQNHEETVSGEVIHYRSAEVGSGEIGAGEIRTGKVRLTERCAAEVCS
jgi:hypothetical protein